MISTLSHSLFSKNGIVWGQTQSGKTTRLALAIEECPHHCFFINTQLVPFPEEHAQITVDNNVDFIKAIENKNYKICISYKLDWDESDSYLQKVDHLIRLIFTIAQKNPDNFRATIIIDEIDKFVSKHKVSPSIDNLFNRGLRFNLNAIGIGHIPADIHNKLIDASSWYLFFEVTSVAVLYWKKRGIKLDELKYGFYESYYWERGQLWLFSHNRPTSPDRSPSEDQLRSEELSESRQMDHSDVPPTQQDLDSNLHKT